MIIRTSNLCEREGCQTTIRVISGLMTEIEFKHCFNVDPS